MSGFNMPPGGGFGPYSETLEFRCDNPECKNYQQTWEAAAVWELGATFLVNDDDAFCKECGKEGTDI
jgi:hypothetical protein